MWLGPAYPGQQPPQAVLGEDQGIRRHDIVHGDAGQLPLQREFRTFIDPDVLCRARFRAHEQGAVEFEHIGERQMKAFFESDAQRARAAVQKLEGSDVALR